MNGPISQLLALIQQRNPMHRNYLAASLVSMPPDDRELFLQYLANCCQRQIPLDFLADAYVLFVRDTMKEQVFFARHKRYRYSIYEEVRERVYLDRAYMEKYMHGLAISSFLWPNHREMHRFFQSTLPRGRGGTYLEVGPGHGFNMVRAMRLTDFAMYEAVDISPVSVELTTSLVNQAFSPPKPHRIRVEDFLEMDESRTFDALVLGEVLEHVEHPARFLRKTALLSNAESHIYVSTCVNAPEVDHITLFASTEELEELMVSSGLALREQLLLPYSGVSLEEARDQRLPINVAFTLHKV